MICLVSGLNAATYDATGIWNYAEHSHWNNCGEPEFDGSGTMVLIQSGNSFILVSDIATQSGPVNGNQYTFIDRLWEDWGWTDVSATITLSSDSSGSAYITWTWSGFGTSCNGYFYMDLSRQVQNAPAYDASGDWDYNLSGHWNNCGDPNPPNQIGTIAMLQNSNRVSATDDLGQNWNGFVDGMTYTLVHSFAEDSGVTSRICTLNLTNKDQASGSCRWVWDLDGDSSDFCQGGLHIGMVRQPVVETPRSMPWIPLLLMEKPDL
jgi:hypothetical protein